MPLIDLLKNIEHCQDLTLYTSSLGNRMKEIFQGHIEKANMPAIIADALKIAERAQTELSFCHDVLRKMSEEQMIESGQS